MNIRRVDKSFLHIGFPKCASTFLQQGVFTEKNGFYNLMADPAWATYVGEVVVREPSLLYNASLPPLPKPQDTDGNPLSIGISAEGLLDTQQMIDVQIVFERLSVIFNEPIVLIIIRRQEDLMYSDYVQHVRAGYFRHYEYFLRDIVWWGNSTIWHRMQYFSLYQLAKKHFRNVVMIPFELLRQGEDMFLCRLSEIFGRDLIASKRMINPSPSDSAVAVFRHINRFLRHGIGNSYLSPMPGYVVANSNKLYGLPVNGCRSMECRRIAAGLTRRMEKILPRGQGMVRKKVNGKYSELFEAYFAEQNRAIDDLLGLGLESYGYTGVGGEA